MTASMMADRNTFGHLSYRVATRRQESVQSSVYLRFGRCFLRGARTMTISKELLDELLKDSERPDDLLGDAWLMKGSYPA